MKLHASVGLALALLLASCAHFHPGERLVRQGDEIVAAGQLFHTGTTVILWTDPDGYDAYRVERRFAPFDHASYAATTQEVKTITTPNRYGMRMDGLTADQIEKFRGGGWDLETLRQHIDQFVIHYDVSGTSRQCFKTLQDVRDLSVHFMIDLDGTIYQTLDCKERAWHATTSNSRSIGVEMANIGCFAADEFAPFAQWYGKDIFGRIRITIPARFGDGGIHTPGFVGYPARGALVGGVIQGKFRRMYDFTPQQYQAMAKLTATLCTVFPRIRCDYPKDSSGRLIDHKLDDEQLKNYHGILGHYHIQADKADPGPAFQWQYLVDEARRQMQ